MLMAFFEAIALATVFVGVCYGLAHLIARPMMRAREERWHREAILRHRVFKKRERDRVI